MSKYFICSICGNLIEKIEDGKTTPSCCNRTMTKLRAGMTDGSLEKHVPVIKTTDEQGHICKVTVTIGEELHPSTKEHYIMWIELKTAKGVYRQKLTCDDIPSVDFYISKDEKICGAHAYCNLHGLWYGGEKDV